jgi:hypothetical protein
MKFGEVKLRPSVVLGELCLTFIAYYSLRLGFDIPAGVAIGALASLMPKLVDSEEKGQ